ncbi:MAG: transposase [Burkholderiales bacterium]|nr:transposase [Burkholderiales bacterium]
MDEGVQRPEDPGVNDILIAVTDGLKGMPEALAAGVPGHHTADLHRAPDSQLAGLRKLERPKLLAAAIRRSTRRQAPKRRGRTSGLRTRPWGARFPTVVAAWRRAWDRVIPFFAFPPAVRKVIYTTNAIRASTRACARSSRRGGTSRATMRQPS